MTGDWATTEVVSGPCMDHGPLFEWAVFITTQCLRLFLIFMHFCFFFVDINEIKVVEMAQWRTVCKHRLGIRTHDHNGASYEAQHENPYVHNDYELN